MINFISFHQSLTKKKLKFSQKKVIIDQDLQVHLAKFKNNLILFCYLKIIV